MVLAICVGSFAVCGEELKPRLLDDADLLSESDYISLWEKLDEISERQKVDIAIATTNDTEELSIEEYADALYELAGFGFGEDQDGLLLLVDKEKGEWYISTSGYAITAFTDAGIDYIGEQIKPLFSDGDFNGAFVKFAELCDDFVTQAKTDKPYDRSNLPRGPLSAVWIVISLVVGIVVALIVVGNMKGKLKTVRANDKANSYVKADSLNITDSREMFLYRKVTKTEKEQKKDDDEGSSTHTSSSGTTYGGGGGKF